MPCNYWIAAGFSAYASLNSNYQLDSQKATNGRVTYWKDDGQRFLYFCSLYAFWIFGDANAYGDQAQTVAACHGFAHTTGASKHDVNAAS